MAEFFYELGVSHLERKEQERSMVYEIGRFCYCLTTNSHFLKV